MGDQVLGDSRQLTIGGLARLGFAWHTCSLATCYALNTKFLTGPQALRTDIVSLTLEAKLANGVCAELPTNSTIAIPQPDVPGGANVHRGAVYRHLAMRALQFIRVGRYRDLITAARRYLQGKPQHANDGFAQVRSIAAEARGQAHLIVDHDLGGGANHFRHSLVKTLADSGATVFILTFHVPTLRYAMEYRRHAESIRLAVDVGQFLHSLSDFKLRRVHWNNAVSFTRQIALLNALTLLVRRTAVPVTYYLHDYHSICPSHFLLGKDGEYCNVPSNAQSARSLPEMRDGLVSLFAERDIRLWRRRWEAFLTEANEIVYFSEASMALLMRAYPQLARHPGLRFRPHYISDFVSRPLPFDLHLPLNVGVVGRINSHKGARVVGQMAEAIERSGAQARITVIGALDGVSK
jgi:glycosyltransferase involved in cell wall biosynthesis